MARPGREAAAASAVWILYPLSPAPGQRVGAVGVGRGSALLGTSVQLRRDVGKREALRRSGVTGLRLEFSEVWTFSDRQWRQRWRHSNGTSTWTGRGR